MKKVTVLFSEDVIYYTKFLSISRFSTGWNVQNVASTSLFEGKDFCILTFLYSLKQYYRGDSLLYRPCIIIVLEPKYGYKVRAFWFRAGGTRGIAIEGEAGGPWPPLQFPNQTRSKSSSFKHQGYCFLWVFRNYMDQKFYNFYHVCCDFWTIHGS